MLRDQRQPPLLDVVDVSKHFPIRGGIFARTVGHVRAVDGVTFHLHKGDVLGLVGESGCGKTTIGRVILRLLDKTRGQVLFKGVEIHQLSRSELRHLRPKMQIVFQDPYSSLNPRLQVGAAIGEALLDHGMASKRDIQARVHEMAMTCGLSPSLLSRYPHEFSGGQLQRICIARALMLNPELLVADEPVSALDVSIQAQIINLLSDLQARKQLTYLFISHDLSVVKHLCNRIGVMYSGSLVEMAPRDELFQRPLHPYTQALISAIPVPDPTRKPRRIIVQGESPSSADPPSGCKFHPRCPLAIQKCKEEVPLYRAVSSQHHVACHVVH